MRKEIEMKVREEISKAVVKRYKKSSKKEKGKILDEFTKITGYNRSYASWLLNNLGRQLSRILCLAHLLSSKS